MIGETTIKLTVFREGTRAVCRWVPISSVFILWVVCDLAWIGFFSYDVIEMTLSKGFESAVRNFSVHSIVGIVGGFIAINMMFLMTYFALGFICGYFVEQENKTAVKK